MGNTNKDELVKGYECLHCVKVLDPECKGHLPNVNCVNYEERRTNNGGKENVYEKSDG